MSLFVDQAEHEDTYGKDRSNGWTFSHPIKKLYLFQCWTAKELGLVGIDDDGEEELTAEEEEEEERRTDAAMGETGVAVETAEADASIAAAAAAAAATGVEDVAMPFATAK